MFIDNYNESLALNGSPSILLCLYKSNPIPLLKFGTAIAYAYLKK